MIEVLGLDLQEQPVETKRHISFIPDHPDLYERLTGWEYLSFIAGTYRLDKTKWIEKADWWLGFFELTDLAGELIQTFSHGMRQRLCFTAAFLTEPELLLIDEPWTGLDPKHLKKAITALRGAAEKGQGVILSTHSLSLAEEIGGRIGILHKGSFLWDGPQEQLTGEKQNLEEVFLELTDSPT